MKTKIGRLTRYLAWNSVSIPVYYIAPSLVCLCRKPIMLYNLVITCDICRVSKRRIKDCDKAYISKRTYFFTFVSMVAISALTCKTEREHSREKSLDLQVTWYVVWKCLCCSLFQQIELLSMKIVYTFDFNLIFVFLILL